MNVTECCLLLLLIIGERVINATWQHITYLPANLGSHENYSNISASFAETCSYFCAKSRDCLGFTYSEPLKACGLANCVSSDTKPTNLIRATGYVVSTLDIDSTITSGQYCSYLTEVWMLKKVVQNNYFYKLFAHVVHGTQLFLVSSVIGH